MTTTQKFIEVDTIIFLIVAAVAGVYFAYFFHQTPFHLMSGVPTQEPMVSPTNPPAPTPVTQSQVSPDGTKKITLQTLQQASVNAYTVTIANADDTNASVVYSATGSATAHWQIPFNTWSPDNNYYFLEDVTPDGTNALV